MGYIPKDTPEGALVSQDSKYVTRSLEFYLLVHWETGEVVLRKTDRDIARGGTWIPCKVKLVMKVPREIPELSLEVVVPESIVREIVLDALDPPS